MHGNRDFLVGPVPARRATALLDDLTVLTFGGRRWLLTPAMRCAWPTPTAWRFAQVRGAAWQQDFLADRWPSARRWRGLRDASEQRKRSGAEYADLDADATRAWLDAARAPVMVHGHPPASRARPGAWPLARGAQRLGRRCHTAAAGSAAAGRRRAATHSGPALMFGWLRKRRALRHSRRPLAGHAGALPVSGRPPGRRGGRLRVLAAEFLDSKERPHGAGASPITDDVALDIAQAVLPVLHLGLDWYDDFVGIVVHPGSAGAARGGGRPAWCTTTTKCWRGAMEGGPVMLSWRTWRPRASAWDGYNVVIHGLLHKIDVRDGAPDGCPPLPSAQARREWLALLQAEYDAFREKVIIAERFGGEPTWLDPYGAEALDEFFAVACEAYFEPRALAGNVRALVPAFHGSSGRIRLQPAPALREPLQNQ